MGGVRGEDFYSSHRPQHTRPQEQSDEQEGMLLYEEQLYSSEKAFFLGVRKCWIGLIQEDCD